jgi:hypothetical protein
VEGAIEDKAQRDSPVIDSKFRTSFGQHWLNFSVHGLGATALFQRQNWKNPQVLRTLTR